MKSVSATNTMNHDGNQYENTELGHIVSDPEFPSSIQPLSPPTPMLNAVTPMTAMDLDEIPQIPAEDDQADDVDTNQPESVYTAGSPLQTAAFIGSGEADIYTQPQQYPNDTHEMDLAEPDHDLDEDMYS